MGDNKDALTWINKFIGFKLCILFSFNHQVINCNNSNEYRPGISIRFQLNVDLTYGQQTLRHYTHETLGSVILINACTWNSSGSVWDVYRCRCNREAAMFHRCMDTSLDRKGLDLPFDSDYINVFDAIQS